VYAINHNYATFEIEQQSQLDTSYTLYSRESVERMYRDNPKLYHDPGKENASKLAKGEIKAWNKRKVQSVITQGILQGESIPQLTKRLERVTGGAHAAAIRNARTMITGTQNAGRIDAMDRAKDMGIPVRKQWLATLDTRTRILHRELDGKIADTDKPFTVEGYKIMFPGDPTAHPGNVYNCRCTLTTKIIGFKRKDGSIKRIGENDAFDYTVYDKMNYVSVRDSLSDEDKKAFAKLMNDSANAYNKENVKGLTVAEYRSALKAG
jgi:SPP1 gp7 family putative phage head morphogenesis protein